MRTWYITALAAWLVGLSSTVHALPRFAARNGSECIECHVSPTGGGMRNAYGRNVFGKAWLPFSTRPRPQNWMAEDPDDDEDGPRVVFDGDINDWLALGGDFRLAYFQIRPESAAEPDMDPDITSTFFLMQADLYHAATLDDHVSLVLDVGIYSGFEAWGLFKLRPEAKSWNLMAKVGRFMPAFGIREVEHQLFTREGIGLGNTARDTGVELTGYAGPLTAHLALLNGVLQDAPIDSYGSERRSFEKAVAARLSIRKNGAWLRAQLGTSFYYNRNTVQVNPLFGGAIAPERLAEVGLGLDEIRAGGFITANIGRFTYLGDLAYVRDSFTSALLADLAGYASYQELSFIPVQGLEFIGTFEFADPDVQLLDNSKKRAGLVVEFFPWPFTELRAMIRHTWDRPSATGDSWDLVVFAHLFM